MQTIVTKISPSALEKAGKLIADGQLVAFPTETVYGLGADALNEEAVRSVFTAKGRPQDNPLIVHIASMEEAERYCEVPGKAFALMETFWPGPLTLLMEKKKIVPAATTAGLPSVALRCPGHDAARALIRAAGVPIAAPSANASGRPSPTTAPDVYEDLQGKIPLILDGGPCTVGLESTVLDVRKTVPVILRPGAVTQEDIAALWGDCALADSLMRPLAENEQPLSPGMKHRHYAPKGKMTVVFCDTEERTLHTLRVLAEREKDCCILCLRQYQPFFEGLQTESLGENVQDYARNLFALLRTLDRRGVRRIFAQGVHAEGLGLAVMNRSARAAGFDIVTVDTSEPKEDEIK